uniref:Uncharacterized protein n=1 Tax=Helicotheca tamesis TaxID=374047 RepID=A0A7S2HIW1_9STRA|mmetsp:Transcript_18553/g.25526  ORF Transcript_18553/g.25526 Transcript_18553/m.25526 type:complete len:164 (+) Transcript_18553:295-786(+)
MMTPDEIASATGNRSASMRNPTTESLGARAPETRRATAPGVVHVSGRAPGQVPSWARPAAAIRNTSSRIFHPGRIRQPQTADEENLDHQRTLAPSHSQELRTAEVRLSANSDTPTPKRIEIVHNCRSLFNCQEERCAVNYFLIVGIILMISVVVVLCILLSKG